MNQQKREQPADPRDKGGRNESGENEDTRIKAGQHLEDLKPGDVKARRIPDAGNQ
jgi:hypothetical protein